MTIKTQISPYDRLMGRLLRVEVPAPVRRDPLDEDAQPTGDEEARSAQNAMGASLLFSGIRCTLQYAILPFVLPVIGVATDAAVPLLLALNVVAMISIVFSLRRFWAIGYKYRWQYLFVAVVALGLLTVFLIMDVQAIQG